MDGCERPSEIDRTTGAMRCDAIDAVERSTERSTGRGTGAGRTPTRARRADGWFLLLRRTDGRTARERFENGILSDRSKPFARVGIYIRLMYGMYAPRATVAMLSTLKNPKP